MEQVLVVKRAELDCVLPDKEFVNQGISHIEKFILDNYQFLPRQQAEYDANYKQIIPYVLIRRGEQFFMLKRLLKQTESRLHNKLSLGVGGHINPEEADGMSVLEAGLYRELREEVLIHKIVNLQCIGIVNQNKGDVSDYHLGIVYLLNAEGEVSVLETEKMEGTWADTNELIKKFDWFEPWSQIIIRRMISTSKF